MSRWSDTKNDVPPIKASQCLPWPGEVQSAGGGVVLAQGGSQNAAGSAPQHVCQLLQGVKWGIWTIWWVQGAALGASCLLQPLGLSSPRLSHPSSQEHLLTLNIHF